jgi:hypothetical protein
MASTPRVGDDAQSSSEVQSKDQRRALDVGSAQLLAWAVLALLNQPLLALLLPPASAKVRALHHAYDAAQLVLLGVLSWVVVGGYGLLRRRWRASWLSRWWARPVLVASAVLLVGLLTVADDVANLAARTDVPHWLLIAGMATTFASFLGASQLGLPLQRAWSRTLSAGLGVAIVIGNALTLKGDYFAHHLLTSWLGALLIGRALEGLVLPAPSRRQVTLGIAALSLLGAASLVVPPKGDVRLRLYELPSSVLAPLTARLLSDEQSAGSAAVAQKYLSSAWFKERSQLPDVPPTRAIVPAYRPVLYHRRLPRGRDGERRLPRRVAGARPPAQHLDVLPGRAFTDGLHHDHDGVDLLRSLLFPAALGTGQESASDREHAALSGARDQERSAHASRGRYARAYLWRERRGSWLHTRSDGS